MDYQSAEMRLAILRMYMYFYYFMKVFVARDSKENRDCRKQAFAFFRACARCRIKSRNMMNRLRCFISFVTPTYRSNDILMFNMRFLTVSLFSKKS